MKVLPRRFTAFLGTTVLAAGLLVTGSPAVVNAQTGPVGPVSVGVENVGLLNYANWTRTISEGSPRQGDTVTVTNVIQGNDIDNYTNILWMKEFYPTCFEPVDSAWTVTGNWISSAGLLSGTSLRTYSAIERVGDMARTAGTEGSQKTQKVELVNGFGQLRRLRINASFGAGLTTTWTEKYEVNCAPGAVNSGGFTWDDSLAANLNFTTNGPNISVRPVYATTTTTLSIAPPPEEGVQSTLTANVAGGRDGDAVQFFNGTNPTPIASGVVTGGVAIATWNPSAGTSGDNYSIVAKYLGSADFAPSNSEPSIGEIAEDNTAPAPPENIVISPQPANDGAAVTVKGSAEPGSSVSVMVDGVQVCTAPAAAAGSTDPAPGTFSCTFPADETQNGKPVTATATDAAANTSDPSEPQPLLVSAQVPPTTVTSTVTSTAPPTTVTLTEVTTEITTTTEAPTTVTVTDTETVTSEVPTTVVSPTTVTETTTEPVPTTVTDTVVSPTTVTDTETVTSEVPTTVVSPTTVTETVTSEVPTTVVSPTTVTDTETVTSEVPTTVTGPAVTTTIVSTAPAETVTSMMTSTATSTVTDTATSTVTETATSTVTSTAVATTTTTAVPGGIGSIGSGSLGGGDDALIGSIDDFVGTLFGSLGIPAGSVAGSLADGSSSESIESGSLGAGALGSLEEIVGSTSGSLDEDGPLGSLPLGSLGAFGSSEGAGSTGPAGSLGSLGGGDAGSLAVGALSLGALAIGGIIYGINTGAIPLPEIGLPPLPPALGSLVGAQQQGTGEGVVAPGPVVENGRG